MNMKNNTGATTQKEGKGKKILTTAGAVAAGAVAGAGTDRLFHGVSNESTGETTEENQLAENNTTAQTQGSAEQQAANNTVGQNTDHRGTASHTAQTENGKNSHAETNNETANDENVETEAVAVAERLVGHNGTPDEVDRILNETNEGTVTIYTENGTEVPLVEISSSGVESTLAEMSEEEQIPDDLFEEDSDSLSPADDTNEMADLGEGLDIDSDDEDILEI